MGSGAFLACIAVLAMYGTSVTEAQAPPSTLGYNYFDQMAQSYCAAQSSGWVFAIRRDCASAPTCNTICAKSTVSILATIGNQRNNVKCYDAFHVTRRHAYLAPNTGTAMPDAGKVSLATHGYGAGGCTWRPNHCGPNYCCCKAY